MAIIISMERSDHNISLERLEACLAMAAYAVTTFGPQFEAHFLALEHAVAKARAQNTNQKAKALLDAYTRDGGLNAIFANASRVK